MYQRVYSLLYCGWENIRLFAGKMTDYVEHIQLHNQVRMPLLGLGTYRLKGEAATQPVRDALNLGYRHIDTASVYGNEQAIGDVVRYVTSDLNGTSIKRQDLFITTKLAPKDQGYVKATAAIDASIERLGGTPIDLFLIHWPGCGGMQLDDPAQATMRLGSWQALEKALTDGKVHAIGVSNFEPRHLTHLLENATVVPHVNQIELHPACPQPELLKLCKLHKIQIVAYASLGVGALLNHSTVNRVASRRGHTPAQVLLRWGLQKGACVIPKASSTERITENYKVFGFELDSKDMAELDDISKEYQKPQHFCWNPGTVKF